MCTRINTVHSIAILLLLMAADLFGAEPVLLKWNSATVGGPITGRVHLPAQGGENMPAVVYLSNLAIPRIGREADDVIIADLVAAGHIVLVLDYAHDPKTSSPALNADMLKLRRDIAGKTKSLLVEYGVDPNHLFILIEGYRLKRDVEFARDGQRVLGMDIIYPSKPPKPAPALMEITCDNKDRMGSFSLLYCTDTLLEGAEAAGFAVAMVDHPVPPPYKGIDDPMPQSIERMHAAVEKLRSLKDELSLNGKIGVIGFSRGGPFAAILACTGDVQAAMIHGNRYDYLDLLENDPMLKRFEQAWGPRDANREKWAIHGASHYLKKDAGPMFLNTSNTESPEYRKGLEDFSKRLDELKIEHVYQVDQGGRGHHVTTDPQTLEKTYSFFAKQLTGE